SVSSGRSLRPSIVRPLASQRWANAREKCFMDQSRKQKAESRKENRHSSAHAGRRPDGFCIGESEPMTVSPGFDRWSGGSSFILDLRFTIYALSWPGVSIAAGEPMVLSLCRGLAGGQGPKGQTLCLPALVVQRRVLQCFQDRLLA